MHTRTRGGGHVVLAGGSGFLGRALLPHLLARFERVIVLTRSPTRLDDRVHYLHWDGKTAGDWSTCIDRADAIINFTGRSVDCRKTAANRREILASRVDSVRALASACKAANQPPRCWVQAGTAHIHGDTGDELIDESSPTGRGFAPDIGCAWEAALNEVALPGCRKIVLRTSFVLGREGGALRTLARLTRAFLGGTVGSGNQYISWIHEHDFIRIVLRALEDASDHPPMAGVYLVTAPNPVANRDFMAALRHVLHRPWSPPAPALAVRVGSFFLRTDPELALLGRRCVPSRLLREGFVFDFPELDPALSDLLA